MRHFDEIHALAAGHHGGAEAVEALLPRPLPAEALAAIPDDRWLSTLSRMVFSAGFNWQVVEAKWPGFENAFHRFVPGRCALMDDEALEIAAKAGGIGHMAKARAIRDNAVFFGDLAREHGSAAAWFAARPATAYAETLETLKKRGARLGGTTAQYFLRMMGADGWVTSTDMVAALQREGVIDGPPTSKKAMAAIQTAYDTWRTQSGRPNAQISRLLALSIG
ncbi:MAG: DNA-3-methyladenine glycosylase I [Pseudomonadota bacterium]